MSSPSETKGLTIEKGAWATRFGECEVGFEEEGEREIGNYTDCEEGSNQRLYIDPYTRDFIIVYTEPHKIIDRLFTF